MNTHAVTLPRPKSATVQASMLFLEPPEDGKPVVEYSATSGEGFATAVYTSQLVTIRDARATHASLDVEGFALVRRRSAIDFLDAMQVVAVGEPEAARLVRDVTGAARVLVFDHTVRRRSPKAARQPSTRVHNDYTERSAPQRVRDLLGVEAEPLLKKRFAFINVWRPIRHPAQDWPLALADARSVRSGELVPTDIVYSDRQGEIYGLLHDPRQRWWYYPDVQLDEAVLIKCYDSDRGVARFAPHTAFESPLTPRSAPPRESIEFRTIAFFDEKQPAAPTRLG